MQIGIGCEFVFDLPMAAHAVVLVEPHPDEWARVQHSAFSTEPELDTTSYRDAFGNVCRRVSLPGGRATLRYEGTVLGERVADDADEDAPELRPEQLPDDALVHLLPSRYCQSDEIAPFALEQFGRLPTGYRR